MSKIIDFKTKKDLTKDKKLHNCSNCGKNFFWDDKSVWYGSWIDFDNNNSLLEFCSHKCAEEKTGIKVKGSRL